MKVKRSTLFLCGLIALGVVLVALGTIASRAQGGVFDLWGSLSSTSKPQSPSSAIPSFPTPQPIPTATLLPGVGLRLSEVRNLTVEILSHSGSKEASFPRLISPDTDGKTLAGVIEPENLKFMVVAIDLASGAVQTLSNGQDYSGQPSVSGKYVVWTTLHQVHFYNLEDESSGQLASGLVTHARVSGNIVVWVQDSVDIWGYNLNTGESFPIAVQPKVIEELPEISGDWVAYLIPMEHPQAPEIWVKNIQTQDNFSVGGLALNQYQSSEPYLESLFVIDAPWVAWSTDAELHFYNLDTRSTHTVTVEACFRPVTVQHDQQQPVNFIERVKPGDLALSGKTLIFNCGQPLGYDIERNVFFSLPILAQDPPNHFAGWTISGDRLIWVLTSDPWEQQQSRIYTALITR